jgi:hypothetical protein
VRAWVLLFAVVPLVACGEVFVAGSLESADGPGGGNASAGGSTSPGGTTSSSGTSGTTASGNTASGNGGSAAPGGGGQGGVGGDGGAGGAMPTMTCLQQYGSLPGYELCKETPTRCEFNVLISGYGDCNNRCAQGGGICLETWRSSGSACSYTEMYTCDAGTQSDNICVCTRL